MRRLGCLVALVIAMALPLQPAGAAQASISGRVVIATDGSPGSGIQVTVVQLGEDRQEKRRSTATTGLDGSFTIGGFDAEDTDTFVTGATYRDVTYSHVSRPGEQVELSVYETTSDDGVVEVASDTLTIVKGENDTMEVLQVMRISNSSRTTYVGSPEGVLVLPVPEGAFDLSAGEGVDQQRLVRSKQGAATMDPLLPGETTITYAYKVRVARGGWSLRRPIAYPTDRIDVLVGDGLLLDAQLRFQEKKKIGSITYQRYRGGPFNPGAFLGVDVRYVQPANTSLFTGLAILVAGSASTIAAGTYVMRKRNRRAMTSRSAPSSRQELIDEIAQLDESFAAAALDEDDYQEQRRSKMKQLEQMTPPR